jgi:hypothetical protein
LEEEIPLVGCSRNGERRGRLTKFKTMDPSPKLDTTPLKGFKVPWRGVPATTGEVIKSRDLIAW